MTTHGDVGARPGLSRPGAEPTVPPSPEYLEAWTAGYLAGHERGYQERVAEENAEYPPRKVLVFGRWYDQATQRAKWDAETAAMIAEAGR